MARKIYGRIKNTANNTALANAKIRAFDSDIGDDDFMGESYTNSDGAYEINYRGGDWDLAVPGSTKWRPDIYITVSLRNSSGQWVKVGQSRVYDDHKMANDLKIDLNVNVLPTISKRTLFDPRTHGYKFANSFQVSPEIFNVELGTWNMGFCGGMSAGALKLFKRNSPAPLDSNTPVEGTALFNELKDRQIRSLDRIIDDIYEWQSSPDEGHWNRKHSVGSRTKKQWPILKEMLDADKPSMIVLIRVEGYTANMSKNHQILAIGYQFNPTTKDLIIETYDPNEANETNTLSMNLGLPNSRLNASDSTGARLRGFFVNPNNNSAST